MDDNFKYVSILALNFFTKIAALVISIFTPIKAFVFIVFLMVLIDTAFGIYSVHKIKGWGYFTSNKLFNIVPKLFFYFGTILLSYQIDTHIFEGSINDVNIMVTKVVTFIWLTIETKSIDETSVKLGNKPILDTLQDTIKRFRSIKKDVNL